MDVNQITPYLICLLMKLLNFAFIGAFPERYHQFRLNGARAPALPLSSEAVKLNVGGVEYSLFSDDIRKHPGSYFETLLSKNHGKHATISRDGTLFKFVNAYLVSGQLPRDATGRVDLNCDALEALKNEAVFFGLSDLLKECERTAKGVSLTEREPSSITIFPAAQRNLQIVKGKTSLISTFQQMRFPLTLRGVFPSHALGRKLIKETSGNSVDVEKLVSLARRIPQAGGADNPSVLEIKACLLNYDGVRTIERDLDVSKLFPDMERIDVRAEKLVFRTTGDNQNNQLNFTNDKECLGFVDIVLNSSYTGGELQVMCDGQVINLKTCPYDWVAVHADASCSIRPVTSGARVSLVLGLYGTAVAAAPKFCCGTRAELYGTNLLPSSRRFSDADVVAPFISAAKYLRHNQDISNATKLEIDAIFLNDDYLTEMLSNYFKDGPKEKVPCMFPQRKLDFRATKAQVRIPDASDEIDTEVTSDVSGKEDGYLGTLVMVTSEEFTGGVVHVNSPDGTNHTIDVLPKHWYAVAAGCTASVEPIRSGNRLSLHYDIYDVTPAHDPLSRFNTAEAAVHGTISGDTAIAEDGNEDIDSDSDSDSDSDCRSDFGRDSDSTDYNWDSWTDDSYDDEYYGYDGDDDMDDAPEVKADDTQEAEPSLPAACDLSADSPPMIRITASEKTKSDVQSAVEAELSTADALVVSLQHVYPEHNHKDFSNLIGGDRALYNLLTSIGVESSATTSKYDVQPVTMTLHSARDAVTGLNKLVSGTYSALSAEKVALSALDISASAGTKLVIPVTLTSEHVSAEDKETYIVAGLRISRR